MFFAQCPCPKLPDMKGDIMKGIKWCPTTFGFGTEMKLTQFIKTYYTQTKKILNIINYHISINYGKSKLDVYDIIYVHYKVSLKTTLNWWSIVNSSFVGSDFKCDH